MTRILISLSFFMGLLSVLSGNDGGYLEKSVSKVQGETAAEPVAVDLALLKRTPTRLEIQVKVKNLGERPVVVVTDPVRLDGSEGVYLSLNENDSSQLELAFAVYPPPFYTRLAPKTRVTFRRLEAGGAYQTNVVLDTPLKDTKPPWGETPNTELIDLAKIHQIRANVGILPDDPGVHDAFTNNRSPDGFELVKKGPFKGKLLFELQALVSSRILKL